MGGFLIAWLVGLSLHIAQGASEWKYTTSSPGYFPLTFASPLPPKPGQILIASGIYVGLAIFAENPAFRGTATLMAWGYNIAIGLTWAQNYATEKNTNHASNGTLFWDPPTTASSNLFPTGTGPAIQGKAPASYTPPANPTSGGQVA